MSLLTTLLLLLVSARLCGEVAVRLRQPAILGEIVAGLCLGPAALDLVRPSGSLGAISELAVFLIIMASGLEMDFREIVRSLRGRGFALALLSFVLPFGAGVGLGLAFGLDAMRTTFLGLCLSITALPVAVRILESLDLQKSPIATFSIGSAIFSDIAAMLALGVILQIPGSASYREIGSSIAVTGSKLVVFGGVVLLINKILQVVSSPGHRLHGVKERLLNLSGSEALFGIASLFVLAFSSVSDSLGFHFVIGAFFGALLLSHDLLGQHRFARLQKTTNSISTGFLAPVFFASLGLQIDLKQLQNVGFVTAVIVVGIVTKIIAGIVGGRFVGLGRSDSWKVGAILNGRGVMGIVVADIALHKGFIGPPLFATLILMSIVTTALTPLMIKGASVAVPD